MNRGKETEASINDFRDTREKKEELESIAHRLFRISGCMFEGFAILRPNDELALRARVQSAVCSLRALDYDRAIEIFKRVIADPASDEDSVAYSMYWTADAYMKKKDERSGYRMLKRLVWKYPFNRYTGGIRHYRLTEEDLVRDDQNKGGDSK